MYNDRLFNELVGKNIEGSGRGLICNSDQKILLKVPRKNMKSLNHNNWCPEWDFNLGPPQYVERMLTIRQQRSLSEADERR
jgi:hypothetical protein